MSNPKELRKQLRNVIQDLAPTLITNELVETINKQVLELQKTSSLNLDKALSDRLDRIEKEVHRVLLDQDKRARAVQGFLVQSALKEVNEFIHNTHITMLAWQEVMTDKLGATEDLNAQIDARKGVIAARIQAEKEAAMAARLEASKAAAAAEQEAKTETPSQEQAVA